MAKAPPGKSAPPPKPDTRGPAGKAGSASAKDKSALHAPLEMRSQTHEESARNSGSTPGGKDAKARLKKKRRASRLKQMATLSALPIMVLLVLGIYTALWFNTAHSIQALVENQLAAEKKGDDWDIKTDGDVTISGFPLIIRGTLKGVTVKAPERWGGWTWAVEALRFEGKAWGRNEVTLEPFGKNTLTFSDGSSYDISAETASMLLSLGRQDSVDGVTLTGKAVTFKPLAGGAPAVIGTLDAQTKSLSQPPNADIHTPAYEGSLSITETTLPPEMAPPIGPVLHLLEVQGRLLGQFGDEGSWREKVAKWRDAGGAAEMDHFYINWAPLRLAATGTLALDDRMQPVGALSTQIQGFLEAADGLYKAKAMRARDLTLARVVLSSMAEAKNNIPTLTMPMSLQNSQILLGPVTVVQLPMIHWPGPAEVRDLPLLRPNYQVDRWGNVNRQD